MAATDKTIAAVAEFSAKYRPPTTSMYYERFLVELQEVIEIAVNEALDHVLKPIQTPIP